MSLSEEDLKNKKKVFDEWIGRYATDLRPYTQDGVPRKLTENSFSDFWPPPGNTAVHSWIQRLKQQQPTTTTTTTTTRPRGGAISTPKFTIQFDKNNEAQEKARLKKALASKTNDCVVLLYPALADC